MLLRCNFSFVLPILEYCSPVWGPGVFGGQALFRSEFLAVVHRRRVARLSLLYKVNSNSNHCLFSELPSASTRVRHTRAAEFLCLNALEFEVSRCRTSKFAMFFCRLRFECEMTYRTVFDTGTLGGFKGAVNRGLLP